MKSFEVSEKFEGGNTIVDRIEENDVYLKPNFRDSNPWFSWAFKITGSEGNKINFQIERPIVDTFGHQARSAILDQPLATTKKSGSGYISIIPLPIWTSCTLKSLRVLTTRLGIFKAL